MKKINLSKKNNLITILVKCLLYLNSVPLLILGIILLKLDVNGIKTDLEKLKLCVYDHSNKFLPYQFIEYLVAAEDHRFKLHNGVDFIAVLRVLYIYLRYRKYQGASTIEQQFVRVITGRYERTTRRKIREQILALLLVYYIKDKNLIAKSYLYVAFYGSGLNGLSSFLIRKNMHLEYFSNEEIISLVSRLKYPEPLVKSITWEDKIKNRVFLYKE
ncbi:glycosyl transferase family 51 [Actinobacillus succinogenes 130Z]|uniref:Glycosyl transferase family 51 n=1 Tax=Actinobacillus succinogenes (strain ATCC 55618 / DSM 22257 / CCUG 43843 / 130Z) TaxID=339671 RepID=A6VNH1_ACTSZ|nr:glycosyl transferase family 51 [Actinobacillus succinogenes 130Z]